MSNRILVGKVLDYDTREGLTKKAQTRALNAFNLHKIKTFQDLLLNIGYDKGTISYVYDNAQLITPITSRSEIEKFFRLYFDRINQERNTNTTLPEQPAAITKREDWPEVYSETTSSPITKTEQPQTEDEDVNWQRFYTKDHPKQKAILFTSQRKAVGKILQKIVEKHYKGILIRGEVGCGKTFVVGALARRLIDDGIVDISLSLTPIMYITRATIVPQTEKVLKDLFGFTSAEMEVLNVEQLRSRFGELYVKKETRIQQGIEYTDYVWRRRVYPLVVFCDEVQWAKNTDSTQSKIAQALTEVRHLYPEDPAPLIISISATPFVRVCEGKFFACSTGAIGPTGTIVTNNNWGVVSNFISAPHNPIEYNEAAVRRFRDYFDDYIVSISSIRPQFRAINNVSTINFQTPEEAKMYADAWEKYLEERRKLEEMEGLPNLKFLILVQLLKFRQAAELIRARHIAKAMWESVQKGNASISAFSFKPSIAAVVNILVNDYNVPRSKISLIWGGMGKTKKVKKTKRDKMDSAKEEAFRTKARNDLGMTDYEIDQLLNQTISTETVEQEYDKSLGLGTQSPDERQREIDKFQRGDSLYCLFSFKAGGVGLSLHHTDELTTDWNRAHPLFQEWYDKRVKENNLPAPGKARRKESGYVEEEDIPFIPTRPRETFLSPVYSAMELVQGLGRAPRLTSMSDTMQTVVYYLGTVEESVAAIVSQKLKCLKEVVRMRESWEDIITGDQAKDEHKRALAIEKHLTTTKNIVPTTQDDGIIDIDSTVLDEEDEEETEEVE
jgi:hypothetical protein